MCGYFCAIVNQHRTHFVSSSFECMRNEAEMRSVIPDTFSDSMHLKNEYSHFYSDVFSSQYTNVQIRSISIEVTNFLEAILYIVCEYVMRYLNNIEQH